MPFKTSQMTDKSQKPVKWQKWPEMFKKFFFSIFMVFQFLVDLDLWWVITGAHMTHDDYLPPTWSSSWLIAEHTAYVISTYSFCETWPPNLPFIIFPESSFERKQKSALPSFSYLLLFLCEKWLFLDKSKSWPNLKR